MSDVTRILSAIKDGDPSAVQELFPLVYDELRRLAAQKMACEVPGQTLQATALVHEAYVRLVRAEAQQWDSQGHFFKAAAEAMRRILVDSARRKASIKRGGQRQRRTLEDIQPASSERSAELLALDEALLRFEQCDPPKAELVKLRYYGGLTIPEAAKAMGISKATAARHWAYARAWLHAELQKGDDTSVD